MALKIIDRNPLDKLNKKDRAWSRPEGTVRPQPLVGPRSLEPSFDCMRRTHSHLHPRASILPTFSLSFSLKKSL